MRYEWGMEGVCLCNESALEGWMKSHWTTWFEFYSDEAFGRFAAGE